MTAPTAPSPIAVHILRVSFGFSNRLVKMDVMSAIKTFVFVSQEGERFASE